MWPPQGEPGLGHRGRVGEGGGSFGVRNDGCMAHESSGETQSLGREYNGWSHP